MEEIFDLMRMYHEYTGDKIKLEVYGDGSGGFECMYTGVTVAEFDDIYSIYDSIKECVDNL